MEILTTTIIDSLFKVQLTEGEALLAAIALAESRQPWGSNDSIEGMDRIFRQWHAQAPIARELAGAVADIIRLENNKRLAAIFRLAARCFFAGAYATKITPGEEAKVVSQLRKSRAWMAYLIDYLNAIQCEDDVGFGTFVDWTLTFVIVCSMAGAILAGKTDTPLGNPLPHHYRQQTQLSHLLTLTSLK